MRCLTLCYDKAIDNKVVINEEVQDAYKTSLNFLVRIKYEDRRDIR